MTDITPPQAPPHDNVKLLIRYKILTGIYRRLTGPDFRGIKTLEAEYLRLLGPYRASFPPADSDK